MDFKHLLGCFYLLLLGQEDGSVLAAMKLKQTGTAFINLKAMESAVFCISLGRAFIFQASEFMFRQCQTLEGSKPDLGFLSGTPLFYGQEGNMMKI